MITKEELEKDYIDARKAGDILGLSHSRISRLCLGNRFPGAFKFGAIWIIPKEAVNNHKRLRPGAKPRKSRAAGAAVLEAVEPKPVRPVRTEKTEKPEKTAKAVKAVRTRGPRTARTGF